MLLAPTAEHQSFKTPPQFPPALLHLCMRLALVMARRGCGRDAAPLGPGALMAGQAAVAGRAEPSSLGEQAAWPRWPGTRENLPLCPPMCLQNPEQGAERQGLSPPSPFRASSPAVCAFRISQGCAMAE